MCSVGAKGYNGARTIDTSIGVMKAVFSAEAEGCRTVEADGRPAAGPRGLRVGVESAEAEGCRTSRDVKSEG